MTDPDLPTDAGATAPPGSAPPPPGTADPGAPAPEGALDLGALPGGARAALEAVLMVIDEPVPDVALATALGLPVGEVRALLADLEREYTSAHRGFTLRAAGGGWRFYSRADYAPVIERFLLEGQAARLTQAALETLAVIAYTQPVTRGRIAAVRGVTVDGVVRTLVSRGLVEERGVGEGGAVRYGTTASFLARLGLNSLDELPPLAPYLPGADVLEQIAQQEHR